MEGFAEALEEQSGIFYGSLHKKLRVSEGGNRWWYLLLSPKLNGQCYCVLFIFVNAQSDFDGQCTDAVIFILLIRTLMIVMLCILILQRRGSWFFRDPEVHLKHARH